MKICAVICEYNPFHNGHLWQLKQIKESFNADAVLCVMSGNFVQRGEAAILEKHVRAKHAVQAGADVVIELPTVFATSNAELFAKGAIHLLSSIPDVKTLCFGAENANALTFVSAARILNNEPESVSKKLRALLGEGMSYAKARAQAFADFIPTDFLVSPNNILGLEYTRAILERNADINVAPLQRQGGSYNDKTLHPEFSSATAIRETLKSNESVYDSVPGFVLDDLHLANLSQSALETVEKFALLSLPTEEIKQTLDCSEGLENALKRIAESGENFDALVSARYTSSRIRRIALQNALGIREKEIRAFLQSPLYLRVLAANKNRSDVLSALSESPFPLLIRAHDENGLSQTARACLEKDVLAERVYTLISNNTKTTTDIFY